MKFDMSEVDEYWTADVDDIVVKYNNSTDEHEREQLYRNHLDAPIRRMVECIVATNLIRHINFEEAEENVLHHTVLQLGKYDKSYGKSFSYFTTIAKHCVWNYNSKYRIEYRKKFVSIQGIEYIRAVLVEDFYQETQDEYPQVWRRPGFPEKLTVSPYVPSIDDNKFHSSLLNYVYANDLCGGRKARDVQIVNAIRAIFKNADSYDKINKKLILETVRSQTGYKTTQIRNTIHRIKRNYEQSR